MSKQNTSAFKYTDLVEFFKQRDEQLERQQLQYGKQQQHIDRDAESDTEAEPIPSCYGRLGIFGRERSEQRK